MQAELAETVFARAPNPRKAAGRAIGTFVEIITYYILRAWGVQKSVSVETDLEEYGKGDITHRVEYTLHPVIRTYDTGITTKRSPITAGQVRGVMSQRFGEDVSRGGAGGILSSDGILRNACMLNRPGESYRYVASVTSRGSVEVCKQARRPYMMIECKRVGRDARGNYGPQAIEKAKQGSYVARAVSSLQKIRDNSGELTGILYDADNNPITGPYSRLVKKIVESGDMSVLGRFVMTVGVVSNHGNWFTSESPNKEMKVLGQSYDWLLFLTDAGLGTFIRDVVMDSNRFPCTNSAFLRSYSGGARGTRFTKVRMDADAHAEIEEYFAGNVPLVESWFNVIRPRGERIGGLRVQIAELAGKRWGGGQ